MVVAIAFLLLYVSALFYVAGVINNNILLGLVAVLVGLLDVWFVLDPEFFGFVIPVETICN
ncbi:putative membrane protein [Vibrio phage vB_VchM_Kuja]|uniref:Putative membrane protein n=1 Tax=Vibrio phage vB_VchM_Kuja TaxID=2686437 RepID=A0A6B9J5R2_9CAUD|nr:hypothetical protein HWC83_gp129 [Vibrio phage vB_VchM_Kuja]QGZ16098.1 putative membrane protein [Vibrio phage vB_VchM_Kuja]